MADLKVTDADFDDAIKGLTRTKDGFVNMKTVGDELAGAVGHKRLAQACTSFVSDWSVNRERIERAIDSHLSILKQTKQAFDEAERKLGTKDGDKKGDGKKDDGGKPPRKPDPDGGDGGGGGGGGGGVSPGPGRLPYGHGGGSTPSVGGVDSRASLESTQTEPHQDVNKVGGVDTKADLGKDLPLPTTDPGKVEGAGVNAQIEKELKEKGLPVFEVDGKVQRPLGEVEGIGTLLGSQDKPPSITAVVDANGKVVDIADLKPEYDDKGNLVSLNQVRVPADIAEIAPPEPGPDTKQPGTVDGAAAAAPTLDQRTQEAVTKVKELFGDMVDVAVASGKDGAQPTLTVAGVSGIGIAALAALAGMRRPSAAESQEDVGPSETSGKLREALGALADEPEAGAGAGTAADRQDLVDALLRDLPEEASQDGGAQGASADALRKSLAEAAAGQGDDPLSADPDPEALGSEGTSTDSLRESLSQMRAAEPSAGDLGPDLPPASEMDAGVGASGGDPAAGGGLGGPLPAGSDTGPGGPVAAGGGERPTGPGGTAAVPPGGGQSPGSGASEAVERERRDAHMMGGMGMAAGMSAAGGRGGLTGAEEARRNEEARRLRDRLASLKEKD